MTTVNADILVAATVALKEMDDNVVALVSYIHRGGLVHKQLGGRIETCVGYMVSEGDPPRSYRGGQCPLTPNFRFFFILRRHIFVDC